MKQDQFESDSESIEGNKHFVFFVRWMFVTTSSTMDFSLWYGILQHFSYPHQIFGHSKWFFYFFAIHSASKYHLSSSNIIFLSSPLLPQERNAMTNVKSQQIEESACYLLLVLRKLISILSFGEIIELKQLEIDFHFLFRNVARSNPWRMTEHFERKQKKAKNILAWFH